MADEIECSYCGHTLNVEVTAGVECPHCGATIGSEQTDEVVCPHCEAVLMIYADDFDIGKKRRSWVLGLRKVILHH